MLDFLKGVINSLVVMMIFALLALGIATIALQLPSVQTYAVQTAASSISEKLGYPITIEKVNIKNLNIVKII